MEQKLLTLQGILNHSVEKFPDKEAFGFIDEEAFTYSDVGNKVASLQYMLEKLHIGKGDRVAIYSQNMPNWSISYFAITAMGAVVVPILPDFTPEELNSTLTEIFGDWKTALIATGFLAFSNAILFRTTAGFLEKEPLFMPLLFLSMLFIIKAFKTEKGNWFYVWAVLGGIFTGLAGFSSGLFMFIEIYIAVFMIVEIVLDRIDMRKAKIYTIWFLLTLIVLTL